MQVRVVAHGIYLYRRVEAIWSDGVKLRVQHHGDYIDVLELRHVREIERIDEDDAPVAGWGQRQFDNTLQEAA